MRNALRDSIGLCQDGIEFCIRWLRDTDLIAAYLRHRRMYFSRRRALVAAVRVAIPYFH